MGSYSFPVVKLRQTAISDMMAYTPVNVNIVFFFTLPFKEKIVPQDRVTVQFFELVPTSGCKNIVIVPFFEEDCLVRK